MTMMRTPWVRFIAISSVKWIANWFLVALFLVFVVPRSVQGYGLAACVWILSFIIAFIFARWAFGARMPDRRDTIALCAVWVVVMILFQSFWEFFQYGQLIFSFLTVDILGTIVVEVFAVVLASYVTRRHRLHATISEGMEA